MVKIDYLENRGVTARTYSRWPVTLADIHNKQSLVFNYELNGDRVNWKARTTAEKNFLQQKDGKQIFWNLDRVMSGPKDVVYITEGEIDALSLAEAGISENSILGFGGGAPSSSSEDPLGKKRYGHVLDALSNGLSEVQKFVLCVDNDDAGKALRADLARLLGMGKVGFIDWPDGIKDANEALVKWGGENLRIYLENYYPWPVAGLFRLDELPEPPKLELWDAGFSEWESKVRLAPTMLSVFTGYPGHGKTHFSQQMWFNISKANDFPVALMSAETHPVPHVRKNLRQFYHRTAEHQLDAADKAGADKWISDHFLFMAHPNARPTFPWLLETLEAAVQRDGCRAVLVDPWNKLETEFGGDKTETKWIGECLDELLDAARTLNIHIQILAHPAKPDRNLRQSCADLYSISGSANWFNRVDQGFSIWRPQILDEEGNRQFNAEFYHLKSRFEETGYPCKLHIKYELESGCFRSSDYDSYRT